MSILILYLTDGNPANDKLLFNNKTSPVGSTVNLGSFPAGTKLLFRLYVRDTGINYVTGAGSRNPGGHTHARAQADWKPNETLVSFEDLLDGPFDYNDLSFSFVPTTVGGLPPGWYRNSGAGGTLSVIFDQAPLKVTWEDLYIYRYPGKDPLYWYAEVVFRNTGSESLTIICPGRTDPALVKEHMQGTANAGWVPAEDTFCHRNPSWTGVLKPGDTHAEWAIFHNVPWKDGQVSLELPKDATGTPHFSGWVDPWATPFVAPAAQVCPLELVRLGLCQAKLPEGRTPNLVVMVHGCCTDGNGVIDVWESFGRFIAGTFGVPLPWEVVVWDWHNLTPAFNPGEALRNAVGQGQFLASEIERYTYTHIHLIGHSAGSQLIQTAGRQLADHFSAKPESEQPFLHLTFLDAYAPLDQGRDTYGNLTGYPKHYSEHYVDRGHPVGKPGTDACLDFAFNFNITDWQGASSDDLSDFGHNWPIIWYKRSITIPGFTTKYGYVLSPEHNDLSLSQLAKYQNLTKQQCPVTGASTDCQPATCSSW
jgi:hypothetical protein